jgi:P27 family predicted phage terminase small subunit
MARLQLSDELHALKGTVLRSRSARRVIPLSLLAGRPKCPRHLSKAARKEWLAIVKLLESRGVLDPGAGPTLELYADTRVRWLAAKADLDKRCLMVQVTKSTSKGEIYSVEVENPYLKIAQDCEATLQQLAKALGIEPASREKVKKVKAIAKADATPAWLTKLRQEEDNECS